MANGFLGVVEIYETFYNWLKFEEINAFNAML
jgi:hypothetical protein